MNKIQLVFFIWLCGSLSYLFSMANDDEQKWLRLQKNNNNHGFTVTNAHTPYPLGTNQKIKNRTKKNELLDEDIYWVKLLVRLYSQSRA